MTDPQRPNDKSDQPEPEPLSYQQRGQRQPYQPITPVALQAIAGFIAWVLGVALVVQVVRSMPRNSASPWLTEQQAILAVIGTTLAALSGLAVWLRLRFRWKGFLPGLLLGFGLTCIVPVGLVLIICSSK